MEFWSAKILMSSLCNFISLASCICIFGRGNLEKKNLSQISFQIICSLENAGEDSVLPMLRSVRLTLSLFANSGKLDSHVSLCSGLDAQVHLVFFLSLFFCSCCLGRKVCRTCVFDASQ